MIPDIVPVNTWAGNDSTTTFDFDFLINSDSELKVLHTDKNEYQTTLKLNIDYSISQVGNKNGSFIIFPLEGSEYSVLKTGEKITLMLDIPIAQTMPFGTSAVLNLNSLEIALDYIVRLIQIVDRKTERSVKVMEGSDKTPDEFLQSLEESEANALLYSQNAANSAGLSNEYAQQSQSFANVSEQQAIIASEQANIATQKTNEVVQNANDAILNITNQETTSLENVQLKETETLDAITNAGALQISNIENEGTEQIDAIKAQASQESNTLKNQFDSIMEEGETQVQAVKSEGATQVQNVKNVGFYREDDKLFYYDDNGNIVKFTASSGHSLFDVVLKDKVLTFEESENFAQLGTYVYKTAVAGSRYGYPTFYEQCLKEYQEATADGIYFKHANGHVFYDIANKSEVDAVYNSTGIAWAYGIDTANERIFLPRNDYYFKNGSADDVGNTVNQELPNIKASFNTSLMTSGLAQATSGAASATQISSNNKGGTGHTFTEYNIDINASNSDATYKDGGEVIPKSVSMIAYMVVGNTANEEALTDIIDITTTENDTLPLFYNSYSQQDMTTSGAFVNASLGNYLDGNVWTTAYAEIEKMGIGAKFGAGTIKAYGDSSITDFDLVLNQSNMTFRLPLLNGSEDLPSDRYEELLLPASDTEYTAPANGWYYVYKEALTANEHLTLQNKTSGKAEIIYAQEAYNQCRVSIDAKKGDIVNIGYSLTSTTTKACRFIYAQGNGSLYYKLDNVLQNAQLLDLAGVTSALSKKVSADNLVETPVIIETYNITASNGYIVWSNGWCEQWGRGTAPSTANSWGTTITLNKKYVNKAYGITLTNWGGSTQGAALKWNSDNLTESTFQVLATVSGTSFNWRTWGVLAEGEY